MTFRLARLFVAAVFCLACAAAPARAQEEEASSSESSESTESSADSPATPAPAPSFTPTPYHWLATGLAIGLGLLTIGGGSVFWRVAVETNAHARDPLTTQLDARASANTANDFLLVAEVLWVAGSVATAIGITWSIVLAVSGSGSGTSAAAATARVTPFGVALEGVF